MNSFAREQDPQNVTALLAQQKDTDTQTQTYQPEHAHTRIFIQSNTREPTKRDAVGFGGIPPCMFVYCVYGPPCKQGLSSCSSCGDSGHSLIHTKTSSGSG